MVISNFEFLFLLGALKFGNFDIAKTYRSNLDQLSFKFLRVTSNFLFLISTIDYVSLFQHVTFLFLK